MEEEVDVKNITAHCGLKDKEKQRTKHQQPKPSQHTFCKDQSYDQKNRRPNPVSKRKVEKICKSNHEVSRWNIMSVEKEVKKHKTVTKCWQPT